MSKTILILLALVLLAAAGCVFFSGGSPQHDTIEEREINEASGIAASLRTPGLLYTHNDSGGDAVVYVLNQRGLMPARIMLQGIENHDWEDIAVGRNPQTGVSHILVGDIGDNNAVRKSVCIHRFPEPAIADTLITVAKTDRIEFTYEDGARDAEALFHDSRTGDIYVVTKRENQSRVYRLAFPQSASSPNVAKFVCALPYNWVTAADLSPDGDRLLIKTYTNIYRYKRGKNMDIAATVCGKHKVLRYEPEQQGEAVAWDIKGKGYFTLSERIGEIPVELYYYK